MKRIIVADARDNFLADVVTRMILDDDREIEIATTLSSVDNLHSAIDSYRPDLVAVCDNLAETQQDWNYEGTEIAGYALTADGLRILARQGLPSFGVVNNVTGLLDRLEKTEPAMLQAPPTAPPVPPAPAAAPAAAYEQPEDGYAQIPIPPAPRAQSVDLFAEDEEQAYQPTEYEMYAAPAKPAPSRTADADDRYVYRKQAQPARPVQTSAPRPPAPRPAPAPAREQPRPAAKTPQPAQRTSASPRPGDMRSQLKTYRETERAKMHAERLVNLDLQGPAQHTSVVAIYSAKGGVGKTTLSTEIAVYLSLTSHGRGHYRVCLVDYNIDFGNVRTTLDYEPDGPNMSYWAAEIRERIDAGEAPEDILYTWEEMEPYLQVMGRTGLYSLLAPLTHEDSMDIGGEELSVMLASIKENGGFDFVICDTGNNTRDSSVIALDYADFVLLVVTQDIASADCNDSFLTTMRKINFDINKIRLVVNKIQPAKATGIAVAEIEELFSFPCVARIRHDDDVRRAANESIPIVYKASHEVTREIRKIVAFLTNHGDASMSKPKKKGLFRKKYK